MIRIVVVPAARSLAEIARRRQRLRHRAPAELAELIALAGDDRGVTVAVDQAGHDEAVAEIEHLGAGRRRRADGGDPAVLHGEHGVAYRGGAGTVEQRAAADRACRHVRRR